MTELQYEKPRDVKSLGDCHFYHTMDLPRFGTVEGEWDLRDRFDDYIGGVDLKGKTVIDVGTASGFLTFEAEKRGATVTSFDIGDAKFQHLIPFKDKLYFTDHERWRAQQNSGIERWKNAYWLAHKSLGSQASVFYGDVYHLPNNVAFSVAIVGSVLEHLSDQVSALASISRITKSTLIIVTPVLETEDRIARFSPSVSAPDTDYVWWVYSIGTYREILAMLGFRIVKERKDKFRFVLANTDSERHTIVAERI
jgi:SAM-dependent methyltransferase